MNYLVSATDTSKFSIGEENPVAAILQNIATILSTPRGSVPLYRDFGLDTSFLDKPMPVAKVMMIAPVREAVEKWEPRATVENVSFTEDQSRPGRLIPSVEVSINA